MRYMLVITFAILLAGCVLPDSTGGADSPANRAGAGGLSATLAAASAWLDVRATIASEVRTTTRSGIDLRQALYVIPEPAPGTTQRSHPQMLLLVRDYSSRDDSRPDPQRLMLHDPVAGTSQALDVPDGVLPFRVATGASRRTWLASTLTLADSGELQRSGAKLLFWDGGTEAVELTQAEIVVMSLLTDDLVVARDIVDIKLENGLPALQLDWSGQARRYSLSARQWQTHGQYGVSAAPQALRTADYRISHEPALPGQSRIEYMVGSLAAGAGDTQLLASFPYHVTYGNLDWEPPLAWFDAETLATICFLPDATGASPRPNHNGLFRLVSIDAGTGAAALVEDHLHAGLPIVAGGGVVFYTALQVSGAGQSWELWAASADGLRKQRLASFTADTTLLSVEDLLDGRRLLVHRQYLVNDVAEPQLISELLEYSLDALETATPAQALPVDPLKPFEQSTDDPLKRFVPSATGEGPPPIHVPEG